MLLALSMIAACAAPLLALAAFNDVTLTTSAVLSIGGIEVDVTGSSATIQSIVVGAGSFDVTMQSGSTMTVTAPNRNLMGVSSAANVSSTVTCTDDASSIALTASGSGTVTITPSGTLCGQPTFGGGGGGAYSGEPRNALGYLIPATTSTAAATTTASIAMPHVQEQIQLPTTTTTLPLPPSFKRDLQIRATGADVQALQIYLNTHGFVVAASGAGSPGHETTTFGRATKAALIKLQRAAGIKPAAGYFGPKTRAHVTAHP